MAMNPIRRLSVAWLMVLCFMVVSLTASAQKKRPTPQRKIYTAKEVEKNATRLDRTDQLVTIKGYLVKQLDDDKFLFRDATGTLHVEIDDDDFWDFDFNPKTEFIIVGEVDHDLLEPVEVEAERIIPVKKQKP